MNRKDPELEAFEEPHRRSVPIFGALMVVVVSVFAVVAMAAIAVRTEAGRGYVAKTLRAKTGLDLEIGAARFGLPLELVLERVRAKAAEPYGGFTAREIRLGLQLDGDLELTVTGAELNAVRTADGWLPAAFQRVAALNDVRDTAALFEDLPHRLLVEVRDSTLARTAGDGEELSSVKGLSFRVVPLDVAGRVVRWCEVSAQAVKRTGGTEGHHVRRIWVATRENPYAEVTYYAVWEGGTGAVQDWWSVPPAAGSKGAIRDE